MRIIRSLVTSTATFSTIKATAANGLRPSVVGGFTQWHSASCVADSNQCSIDSSHLEYINQLLADSKTLDAISGHLQRLGWNGALTDTPVKVEEYATQVVAGTNYKLRVTIGDDRFSVKIYKPLPHLHAPPEVTKVEVNWPENF